jgi:hypothetical protein
MSLLVTEPIQAGPITFNFEGTVTSTDFGTISIGSAVTGSYTFDSGLIDSHPLPDNGWYSPVNLTLTFIAGSSITATATIVVFNSDTFDSYSVRIDTLNTLTGSFADPSLSWYFGVLNRQDVTGTAFSDESLPLIPPDLAALPGDGSFVGFVNANNDIVRVVFNLTSLVLAPDLDSDDDGIPDINDTCIDSDLSPTVVIDGCDSGVPNPLSPNGCTIADQIADCAADATTHGRFTSCVDALTTKLRRDRLITGRQKDAIDSCAARADIP